MPKLTTIIVPTVTGTRAMTGYVANIPLNIGRTDLPDAPTVKFLIEIDPLTKEPCSLTHYASGMSFYSHLLDINLQYRLRKGSYAKRLSKRALAEEAVSETVKRLGLDAVLNAINPAPVINR
jgi:hypothetical protein